MSRRCCYVVLLILFAVPLPLAWPQDQQNPQQDQQQSKGGKERPPSTDQEPAMAPQSEDRDKDQRDKKPEEKPTGSNPAQAAADKTKQVTIGAAEATKQAAQATLGKVRDWETQWLVGAYVSRTRTLSPLTLKQRQEIYLQQTWLTPGAYLKRIFDAGLDQARGVPSHWDDGWGGYGERWASREGQFIAANSLAALGNAKLGYEPRYDQCRCRGFWPRTRHAFIRDFLTYNRTERELRPQWALYGGAFGGGLISTAWKPKPRNPFAEGGRAMLGQVAYGTLLNFFTEFAVDINRKLGARR
jgi:hypothetical protein